MVVAEVPVALLKIKSCNTEEPITERFASVVVASVVVPVPFIFVAKKLVVVALSAVSEDVYIVVEVAFVVVP